MPPPSHRQLYADILENLDRATHRLRGLTYSALSDPDAIAAFERYVERATEAVTRLQKHWPSEYAALESTYQLDLAAIRGIGNVYRHGYDNIRPTSVDVDWGNKLVPLRDAMRSELAPFGAGP